MSGTKQAGTPQLRADRLSSSFRASSCVVHPQERSSLQNVIAIQRLLCTAGSHSVADGGYAPSDAIEAPTANSPAMPIHWIADALTSQMWRNFARVANGERQAKSCPRSRRCV